MKVRFVMAAVVGSVVALAGCGAQKGASPGEKGEVTYSAQVEKVFVKRCEGCHSAEKAKGKLVLEKGQGYANLVGPMSTKAPGLPRVKPGDPEGSFLWQKLEGTAREGKAMPQTPYGWKKLPDRELDLVRRWIATGAKP
jgi:mono/diheme cytochrome c family protein